MVDLFRKLLEHQEWADRRLAEAVEDCPDAAADAEIAGVLAHINMVQRFFLCTLEGRKFVEADAEPREVIHAALRHYAERLTEGELARHVAPPFFHGATFSVADLLTQMTLHSQNHRGQGLMLLRKKGGHAPVLDYIIWRKDIST